MAAVRGLAVAVQRPRVLMTLAGFALLAALTSRYWYQPLKRWVAEDASPGVREAAGMAGRALIKAYEEYAAATWVWMSAQRGRPGATLTHRIARMLATSVKPMTRTEMAERLRDEVTRRGHRAVMAELLQILANHQAFCDISRGRWQLGKESVDFGGLALPEGLPAYRLQPLYPTYIHLPEWGSSGRQPG